MIMSLCLSLLVANPGNDVSGPGAMDARTLLEVERDDELFDAIDVLESAPTPKDFHAHVATIAVGPSDAEISWGAETGWGIVWPDSSDRGRVIRAKQFWPLADMAGVMSSALNKAVWAYLAALPPDACVLPFWTS
jgi:hypothetical protein